MSRSTSATWCARLEAERIAVPIVACGIEQRRPRRGRRHPRRRQGIHPAAARSRADRRRARRRRRRRARADLSRRDDGACGQARPADRAERRLGADHRRVRHRQGGDGALRPQPLEPRARAVHLGQLRGDPGEPAGVRAVRPREGRLHRRGRAPHRQVRGGDRRHAAARRDLRDGRAPAGQAAARDPGARDRPRRRHASRCRSTSASSRPPTATWPRRCARARSARTCCSASTS